MTSADASASLRWSIDNHPSRQVIQALRQALVEFNIATASIDDSRNLAVLIHDATGRLQGGIAGKVWGQCLEIDYLWVDAKLRGRGYGTQLLQTMEQEARSSGCHSAVLDTYSFQAPVFYQKLGYRVLGSVDGYPQGYQKVFLKKTL